MSNCECSYSGRTVALSLFVGALAGAAAVLLLAPKARRESVERIRELSNDLKEKASETIAPSSPPPSVPGRMPTRGKRPRSPTATEWWPRWRERLTRTSAPE
jgi:hypothetical protein